MNELEKNIYEIIETKCQNFFDTLDRKEVESKAHILQITVL